MTNTNMLLEAIKRSGYRLSFIAQKLGISRATLYNKIYGRTEFLQSEISLLKDLLNLTAEEGELIFFANDVD